MFSLAVTQVLPIVDMEQEQDGVTLRVVINKEKML